MFSDLLQQLLLALLPNEPVYYIGGSEVLPPPLSREAEDAALTALCAGDKSAERTLIEHNLRLVVYIARRFENTGVGLEDLISIGTIGLIKAVSTFDREKNIKLATYASRFIENEILMYLRKISAQRTEVSFDEPLNTDWDGNELLLSDVLGTDEDEVSRPMEDDADRRALHEAVSKLSERDRDIISLRFGLLGRPRRSPTAWAFRKATYRGSKSASFSVSAGRCRRSWHETFNKKPPRTEAADMFPCFFPGKYGILFR